MSLQGSWGPAEDLVGADDQWAHRGTVMTGRALEAVTLTVANAGPVLLSRVVRRAYEGGATLLQVLLAIDAGYCLSAEPSCCPAIAWATAHEWAWINRRVPPRRPSLHHR